MACRNQESDIVIFQKTRNIDETEVALESHFFDSIRRMVKHRLVGHPNCLLLGVFHPQDRKKKNKKIFQNEVLL